MDSEPFNDLALRVIAGEATTEERHTLETELAAHPELRDEFDQIKISYEVLRTASPMAEATRANEPELPAYRVNELRTAVRQHFGPAANRGKSTWSGLLSAWRWIFAGGGLTALTVLLVVLNLSNHTIEVGLYQTDQMRGESGGLTAQDVPAARLMTFDQDAPFDQWKDAPLAWYERGKVWVDNERDLLHIVRRVNHGQISKETYPLATTNDAQREQIKQAVESLEK
jgi:hypothetical protein